MSNFPATKYWYDATYDGRSDEPFTRQIKEITPQLNRVDTAVSIRDATGHIASYLFSGANYYQVHVVRQSLRVEQPDDYPQPLGNWFGCS
jgi:hypothetical protein